MDCPTCPDERLTMAERKGIEIDYCPKCRGIWLDRGELDKIIERSMDAAPAPSPRRAAPAPAPAPAPPRHAADHRDFDRSHRDDRPRRRPDDSDYGSYRYKKRKSWLSEILDFD
ncbi:MAG: zf-TFIIB domain-containing protein [Phycisphaerales bacterium]